MKAVRYPAGPLETNAYLLIEGSDAVVVDPSGDAEGLLAVARSHGATARAVYLTHAHFDHVAGLMDLLDHGDVPVYLDPRDRVLFDRAAASAAHYGIRVRQPEGATLPLAHGQEFQVGDTTLRCLWTPGHAPGHMAFYAPSEGLVLAGDALFRGSIGRTDLPFGDTAQLLESIRSQLLSLPPETRVLPGHMDETTIAQEAEHNPFL